MYLLGGSDASPRVKVTPCGVGGTVTLSFGRKDSVSGKVEASDKYDCLSDNLVIGEAIENRREESKE